MAPALVTGLASGMVSKDPSTSARVKNGTRRPHGFCSWVFGHPLYGVDTTVEDSEVSCSGHGALASRVRRTSRMMTIINLYCLYYSLRASTMARRLPSTRALQSKNVRRGHHLFRKERAVVALFVYGSGACSEVRCRVAARVVRPANDGDDPMRLGGKAVRGLSPLQGPPLPPPTRAPPSRFPAHTPPLPDSLHPQLRHLLNPTSEAVSPPSDPYSAGNRRFPSRGRRSEGPDRCRWQLKLPARGLEHR